MYKRGFCRSDLTNIYGFINHGTLKKNTKRIDRGLKLDIINEFPYDDYVIVYICNDINDLSNRLDINEIFLIGTENKKKISKETDLEEFLNEYGLKLWTKENNFLISIDCSRIYKNIVYGDIVEFFGDDILDTDGYILKTFYNNDKPIDLNKDVLYELDIVWKHLYDESYLYTFKNNEIKLKYRLTKYKNNKLWKVQKYYENNNN